MILKVFFRIFWFLETFFMCFFSVKYISNRKFVKFLEKLAWNQRQFLKLSNKNNQIKKFKVK